MFRWGEVSFGVRLLSRENGVDFFCCGRNSKSQVADGGSCAPTDPGCVKMKNP